jgi:hypothetical protein
MPDHPDDPPGPLKTHRPESKRLSVIVDAAGNVVGHGEEVTEHVEVTNGEPDWRAAARLAESRYMSRFGNKRKVEMQSRVAHLHVHTEMSPEDVAIAERIANTRLGLDGGKRLD